MSKANRSADVNIDGIDLTAADVVILQDPSGRRAIVKGRELLADNGAASGRTHAKVMTVHCDTWAEVEALMARAGDLEA